MALPIKDSIFRKALENKSTRAVLYALMEHAGVYKPTFGGAHEIAYKSGRRDLGTEILATIMDIDPGYLDIMAKEEKVRLQREQSGRPDPELHADGDGSGSGDFY